MTEGSKGEQLHFAAADGELGRVKALVEAGADVNAFDESLSFTPLHHAVRGGHLAVAAYLLSVGADVNAHDEQAIGETALGTVAANCSYAIAELLIDAGADPTIAGWMQLTALHRAEGRKTEEGRHVYGLLLSAARRRGVVPG